MLGTIRRWVVVLVLTMFLGVGMMGWAADVKPVVYSEPLPCFTMGELAVCFDSGPYGNLVCEAVDSHTILCTSLDL